MPDSTSNPDSSSKPTPPGSGPNPGAGAGRKSAPKRFPAGNGGGSPFGQGLTESILPERYRPLFKQLMADAHELLLTGGHLPSRYYVGSTAEEAMQVVPIDTSDDQGKDASALVARRVATYMDADFVVLVTEAWALPPNKVAEAEAILEKYGSVGNYPKRLDVAWFTLETQEGLFNASAPILPVPPSKKRRKLGQVSWLRADESGGMLAGILARRDSSQSEPEL